MAIRRASDSNLTGKKYNDGSAGGSKIVDVPDTPTINATPAVVNGAIELTATAAPTGGVPTSYSALSNPGSIVANSNTTSINYGNNLVIGTAYTFTVRAVNSSGSSPYTSSSNSIVAPGYELVQTFNTSGTFTVPSGKTAVAIVGTGAGANGSGTSGGSGGPVFILEDVTVTPGSNHYVQIASGGGSNSTFGNVLTVGGGGGTANANAGTFRFRETGQSGGSVGSTNANFSASPGNAGSGNTTATSNNTSISSFQGGGGGGGAGGGPLYSAYRYGNTLYNYGGAGGGGAGGNFNGGNGGSSSGGGQGNGSLSFAPAGGAARGPGGGGGGGHGGAGAGGAARILVYAK
jgi:hypothetical protein